jgi:hypothetical protein
MIAVVALFLYSIYTAQQLLVHTDMEMRKL